MYSYLIRNSTQNQSTVFKRSGVKHLSEKYEKLDNYGLKENAYNTQSIAQL